MNDSAAAPQLRIARFLERVAGASCVEILRWGRLAGGAIQEDDSTPSALASASPTI